VDSEVRAFLAELYARGRANDAEATSREARMLNVAPDVGELLRMLVITGPARRVLELGTSNGYSTIWLADGARRIGGRVVTVEIDPAKHRAALENLARAGVGDVVDARLGDISAELPGLTDFDLVFLDTQRGLYVTWWPSLQRALRPGGLMVVDNVTSHAEEVAPFVATVAATPGYSRVLLPVGSGELLVLKEP
jgi:predicted O-methyltransferase YrrM